MHCVAIRADRIRVATQVCQCRRLQHQHAQQAEAAHGEYAARVMEFH
jgi:hypothetical protein